MNDKITISTAELFRMFPDQETARTYLESRLWPNGCRCPVCGLGDRITARAGGYYRCNQCKIDDDWFGLGAGDRLEESLGRESKSMAEFAYALRPEVIATLPQANVVRVIETLACYTVILELERDRAVHALKMFLEDDGGADQCVRAMARARKVVASVAFPSRGI